MHQDAFPGEDISDRPLPETVVPRLLALLDARPRVGSLPSLPTSRRRASDDAPARDAATRFTAPAPPRRRRPRTAACA